jgi:uncharacterized protein YdhG (YjbR/CyaY superfamily)
VKAELNRIQRIIQEMVPGVTERVIYGIPIFRLGKDLAGLSVSQKHTDTRKCKKNSVV